MFIINAVTKDGKKNQYKIELGQIYVEHGIEAACRAMEVLKSIIEKDGVQVLNYELE